MNGLVIVCGLPGVGKSTFARWLADDLGAVHIRTDVVRKELYDEPTYASEETARVYDELLTRASRLLEEGEAVVLDGTYRKQKNRYQVKEIAASHNVPCWFYKVECDQDVVQQRLAERTDDPSDADFEIHKRLTFDQLERPHVVVDNTEEDPDWDEDHLDPEIRPGKPHEHIDPDEYHTLFDTDSEQPVTEN